MPDYELKHVRGDLYRLTPLGPTCLEELFGLVVLVCVVIGGLTYLIGKLIEPFIPYIVAALVGVVLLIVPLTLIKVVQQTKPGGYAWMLLKLCCSVAIGFVMGGAIILGSLVIKPQGASSLFYLLLVCVGGGFITARLMKYYPLAGLAGYVGTVCSQLFVLHVLGLNLMDNLIGTIIFVLIGWGLSLLGGLFAVRSFTTK